MKSTIVVAGGLCLFLCLLPVAWGEKGATESSNNNEWIPRFAAEKEAFNNPHEGARRWVADRLHTEEAAFQFSGERNDSPRDRHDIHIHASGLRGQPIPNFSADRDFLIDVEIDPTHEHKFQHDEEEKRIRQDGASSDAASLRRRIEREFDLLQESQVAQILALRTRIASIEKRINDRAKKRESIIARKLKRMMQLRAGISTGEPRKPVDRVGQSQLIEAEDEIESNLRHAEFRNEMLLRQIAEYKDYIQKISEQARPNASQLRHYESEVRRLENSVRGVLERRADEPRPKVGRETDAANEDIKPRPDSRRSSLRKLPNNEYSPNDSESPRERPRQTPRSEPRPLSHQEVDVVEESQLESDSQEPPTGVSYSPVAMVLLPNSNPIDSQAWLLPIDRDAVLLPHDDQISSKQAQAFLRIDVGAEMPEGPTGSKWGNWRLEDAAKIADLIHDHRNEMEDVLYQIELQNKNDISRSPEYVIRPRPDSKLGLSKATVRWGRAPGKEFEDERTSDRKLRRLLRWMSQLRDDFDNTAHELDLR